MGTHVIMKKSLAKALLDAGIEHFSSGGMTQGGIGGALTPQNQYSAPGISNIQSQSFLPWELGANNQSQSVYNQQQNLAQILLNQSYGNGYNPALSTLRNQTGQNAQETAAMIASARGASANPGLTARNAAEAGANIEQQAIGQGAALQAGQALNAENELGNVLSNEGSNALQSENIAQNANAAQNSMFTTGELGSNEINANISQQNANNAASTTGGLLGALGSVGGLIGSIFYKGGRVPRYASGGSVGPYATPIDPRIVLDTVASKPIKMSPFSSSQKSPGVGNVDAGEISSDLPLAGDEGEANSLANFAGMAAHGGAIDFRGGGPVPGRAKVKGDSPKNDTQVAMVSPGEDVLPRSVTMAPDAPERAKRFVEALQEKRENKGGYAKVLKSRATLKERVERLEKLCMGGRA